MTRAPTLHTERLTLRPYQNSDWDSYLAFWTSDRAQHMGGPVSAAEAWAWFTNDASTWALNDFGTLAIDVDGKQAGFVGLVQPPNFPEPECGWTLFDGFQGNGYAAEAGAAILAHTFATTELETVVSYIAPANKSSAKVAVKIGGVEDHDATGPANQDNRVFRYMRPATGAIQ